MPLIRPLSRRMYTSSEIAPRTCRPLESYIFAAGLYFAILYPMTLLAGRMEVRRT